MNVKQDSNCANKTIIKQLYKQLLVIMNEIAGEYGHLSRYLSHAKLYRLS